MTTGATKGTGTDRRRQIVVTIAEVACLAGTLVGVGVLGGPPVEQAAGGALAADATFIAPAAPAFGIWTPIYLGLALYTIWQWLPAQTANPRQRATGYLAALTMVLNAGWLLVVRAGWLWVSVVVIAALVFSLGFLMRRLHEMPATSTVEKVVIDGTFGLYLGWVSVATCANIAATLKDAGVDPGKPLAEVIAAAVLAVAAGLGVLFARRLGGRWAVAAALAWGLGWIAWGRWTGEPTSALVAIAAVAAAAIVLYAAFSQRRGAPRSRPRAAPASP